MQGQEGSEPGGERESRGTLCKPSSHCVAGAVPVDRGLATQLDHLVQPQLPAVDGGRLGLQGDDELLCVLWGGQACLEDRGGTTLRTLTHLALTDALQEGTLRVCLSGKFPCRAYTRGDGVLGPSLGPQRGGGAKKMYGCLWERQGSLGPGPLSFGTSWAQN